ncbi:hypothetical protein MPSEU_000605300 [Mayamaea pseudoterrestris]|nr:hypothetical protein MPSEU_000605300 [Mayamaea pseudoterrestris]
MSSNFKQYDIILFGVTGFTGKLAAEYLLQKQQDKTTKAFKWAVCARNEAKAKAVLQNMVDNSDDVQVALPDVLVADLLCATPSEEEALKQVVSQTRVVVTCAGPFERYGTKLVKYCAELGVHYADVTGETDFVRACIRDFDKVAQASGAKIVHHCGNDCIPQDLTVYEMNKFARSKDCELISVKTFVEMPASASFSGGTVATATFQLNKDRSDKSNKPAFDPLLTTTEGTSSEFVTTNASPKATVEVPELECKAGPWIMGPVMVNCVRRSNALLQYNKSLQYGDAQLYKQSSLSSWLLQTSKTALLAAAIAAPSVFGRFLPSPGEGPDRETMENGYLILHGLGVMRKLSSEKEEIKIQSTFQFNKDIGYLYTAALLVETGLLLLESTTNQGGVMTPAVAFGSRLTERIVKELDASFEIKEM